MEECKHGSYVVFGENVYCEYCGAVYLEPYLVCEKYGHDEIEVNGQVYCMRCNGVKVNE